MKWEVNIVDKMKKSLHAKELSNVLEMSKEIVDKI